MGLLYDSTINEHWTADNMWPTSANGSARLWPYSMDSGIPQRCDAVTDGTCSQVRTVAASIHACWLRASVLVCQTGELA